ncbi:hypothetical protein HXX76_011125 [Chlamydomonas incerta]|uniref:SAC3/GANP/THP3 conserved domain-containing protein n=1 Tax=Chlamydomonas incerta TaxID=51695 RepID=A0A835VXM8_CHLIN|nr:hypothetical protein HXX76_011125 [Chlamydomonas incerta]|eukprot:KAG2429359.1 hypothetical protein HXX76_011125 [Chlamydomonas incerta]
MAYQTAGPQAWGAAGAGAAPGMSDPYYAQYYAAYGYGNGYDYSAYYQQQGYPAGAAAAGAQPPPPGAAPPAAPSSPPPPGAEPDKAADAEKPPPPPPGGPPPAPGAAGAKPTPPAPPPGGPPQAPPAAAAGSVAGAAPGAASAAAAAAAAANGGYDSAAYAQWYAQYGYYGYDPQYAQQYWQQQQQQQPQQAYTAFGGAGQPGYQQPKPGVPPPAPPKGDPPPGTGGKPGQAAAAGSSKPYSALVDSYNAQPPPANLYGQQNGHHQQQNNNNRNQRPGLGLTGTNMTPLGPRPPPGDPPASPAGQQLTPQQHAAAVAARFNRGSFVIRPQMPTARPAATPAYIAVGGAASAAAPAKTGVAAAVAAAAAGAAVAAAAVKSGSAAAAGGAAGAAAGSSQWPPSFTAWVTRCFNAARLRGVPDSRLSEKLMAYLDQVKGEGRLWTTDWDTQAVMLPDGAAAGGGGGAAGADGGALSPSGPQGRKRNRWGAVPAGESAGAGDYRSAAGGRGYERSQDVDSDEEDYGQYGGHRHGAPSPRAGGHQHLSNRKRKKLLALESRHQQQRGGGASAASPYGGHGHAYTTAEEQKRRARAGRFGDGRASGAGRYGGSESDDLTDDDYEDEDRPFGGGQVVVGTSNNLEKSYFRLTSQPEPSSVRPEPVLARALERLVRLIAAREATYFYSLDQFKGMRQDCTVQHLRNALTVRVYEAHGRSSLEYGDVAEFNQCQARLGHLYAEGLPGCVAEFTGYRLLYETVHAATAGPRHAGSMTKALLHTMRNVPAELAAAPEIRHALTVREAVMNYNYSGFFRLYATAPHLGRAILDVVVEPLRWAGLNAFVKAADLPVPLSALALILGFGLQPPRPERRNQPAEAAEAEAQGSAAGGKEAEETGKKEGEEAVPLPGCRFAHLAGEAAPVAGEEEAIQRCAQWLADHGAVVVEKGSELVLDTKASRGKMFVPEVTVKIETGDLSVTDFLSRARVAVE